MYSNKENVLQLVALLKEHGISQIVLCPGSRNSPISHSIAADSFFTPHSIVDERSAGFYALGLIQATGQPAAVCCTSGTAVLNLAPSVAEAFYQRLPLLVITADRPAAWIGQMDGQTIPQPGVFNSLVKKAVQLPEINNPEDEWHCNRLINEAILSLDHHGKGPAQINIPISEPLFEYTAGKLPVVRKISRCSPPPSAADILGKAGYADRFHQYARRMIVVGQIDQAEPNQSLSAQLQDLAERHDCVILAEHLANLSFPSLIGNFDPILYSLPKEHGNEYAPSLLITLGGHIVSKRLKQFLRSHPAAEHWHISPDGQVIDLYQHLTDIIETEETSFITALTASGKPCELPRRPYFERWKEYADGIPTPNASDAPFSDLRAAGDLLNAIPDGSALHLGNSSSVRLAQLFPLGNRRIDIHCNRGTSGIEGSLSTAVGSAAANAASGKPTFLLIGDLSFFYDMNGLWNPQIGGNLRILLNNNGGGEIFHALPGLNQSPALDRYIAAAHKTEARAWAESRGFLYLSASNRQELDEGIAHLTSTTADESRPVLLEVFTSMQDNADTLRDYYHQLNTP